MAGKSDPEPPRHQRLVRLLFYSIPLAAVSTLLVVAVIINFTNVIGRYVFEHAIYWTEEILVFLLMWGVFLGMVAVTYKGAHLSMDLLSSQLPKWPQRVLRGLVAVTLILCSAVVVVQSTKVVLILAKTGQVSVAAAVPLIVPHASILVGFALVALTAIIRFRAYLTNNFD